ncbi:hypothetical protein MVEN_01564000 [Mycena venus]|uniref:DUF6534 domain-containing protein n=1 Tax=Mycena venus TaxID=2733690 RepID=A0A8H7CPK6_9AGAR|nr:hypothetical protein MVEN_01564000 [Mycena venus]
MAVTGAVAPILLAAASWVNVALYTLELVLCAHYFARPSRPLINKIGIGLMVLADTVCTLAICFEVGLAIVPAQENFPFIIALAIQIIATYISAVIMQLNFCHLFYVLTGNKVVCGALMFLIFTHLGFSWASGILLLKLPKLGPGSGVAFTVNTVGAVACAATDLVVAICLGYKFFRIMQVTIPGLGTRSLAKRILILSVGSGAICATNTLTMLILLLEGSFVFHFLATIQGRVYTLSLLANFLLILPGQPRSVTTPSQSFGFSGLVFQPTTVPQISRSSSGRNASKLTTERPQFPASISSLPSIDHHDGALHLDDLGLGSFRGGVASK